VPTCSIIVPVYNRASLTRQCLKLLLTQATAASFEIIVVDDGSRDVTSRVLAEYGSRIRVVTHAVNQGFASACNDGAKIAGGEFLVFLNNDTLPEPGWLDALVACARAHPKAAVVGSKLLYPNNTVQHAGVTIAQVGFPNHIYGGFPHDHPAVNVTRRFQAVTGACMLVRRALFEDVGGFDTAYHNYYEDIDLCLRLGERGYETYYCHESVLYHLESQSRDPVAVSSDAIGDSGAASRLFKLRWGRTIRPDEVEYYVQDGLLAFSPAYPYPIRVSVSPLLAMIDDDAREQGSDALLARRSRGVHALMQEKTRLESRLNDLELHLLARGPASVSGASEHAAPLPSWPALRAGASLFDVRSFIAGLYLQGSGIEIGALHSPLTVGDGATVRYVDRLPVAELRRQYPELAAYSLVEPDILDDGERLDTVADASQDFVIGNHFLEHCQDPIGALKTVFRVLKPGGVAYMAVPDKRFTFDRRRPLTSIEHLVQDHEEGPAWSRRGHFEEWVTLGEDISTQGMTVEHLLEIDYSIHYHVWTQFELAELLVFVKKQYGLPFSIELLHMNIVEVIAVLRKDA
jgi:GT2 family glycosyltransferase/SAM-dependent methyltransferase